MPELCDHVAFIVNGSIFGINCIAIISYTIILNILFELYSFPIMEILIISILFSMVGYIVAFALQHVFAAFPTFWIARFSISLSVKNFLITLICCLLWYWILRRKCIKKIL